MVLEDGRFPAYRDIVDEVSPAESTCGTEPYLTVRWRQVHVRITDLPLSDNLRDLRQVRPFDKS